MSATILNYRLATIKAGKRTYCKKIKSEVLYDDNYDYDRFHFAKVFLAEQDAEIIAEEQGISNEEAFETALEEMDESRVWEQLECENEHDYEDAKRRINELVGDSYLLAVGNIGTWRGNFEGGAIYNDFTEFARSAFKDAYNTRIEIEDGILKVEVIHHDGTDNYSLKPLKYRGLEAYNGWDCSYGGYGRFSNLSKQEMHQKLWEKPYYSAFFREVIQQEEV